MNWTRIQLIFFRELRDQLRDRRTMFTICVLPILLYPLTGLMMLQLAQVKTPQRMFISIVGDSAWFRESGARESIRSSNAHDRQNSVHWTHHEQDSPLAREIDQKLLAGTSQPESGDSDRRNAVIEDLLRRSQSDAILVLRDEIADGSQSKADHGADASRNDALIVFSNQRLERSRNAVVQLQTLIEQWHHNFVRKQLENKDVAQTIWQPPPITHSDIAPIQVKQAIVWSKILPLILLVWALTGAFYPAIDLCAGEKERGTLETLLCGPATRKEIVWGKLMTVMCFSIMTAVLNLISLVVTTSFVFRRVTEMSAENPMGSFGPISLDLILWLMVLVIPMSAMFSALALAVASLARSSKEGQYYLMPLILVGFPLVVLPILPGISLSSGTSIVPVTGAVLLSRAFMDGEYGTALMYLPSVACVTVLCCLLATRWAVRQFDNESVLFSEVEKGTKNWLVRFWMHRTEYPTATESVLCGLSILVALFFGRLAMGSSEFNWASFATSTVVIQIGLMLGPTLIMTVMLTRSVRKSLRLDLPRFSELLACGLLAVYLHPTYVQFAAFISREYPLGPETTHSLQQIDAVLGSVPLWQVLLLLAIIPALCEEVVFRGFVFAGLLENKGVLRAVIGSAVLFGLSHGVLQQTVCATATGLLLGWLAYRTAGIACTCLFHMIHNSISMTLATASSRSLEVPSWMHWAVATDEGGLVYTDTWNSVSLIMAIILLAALMSRGGARATNADNNLSDQNPNPTRPELALATQPTAT
ncbi:MAG: ABC transporter permease subunit/CPBP intramembrane protease [Planctomycetota bacterium]